MSRYSSQRNSNQKREIKKKLFKLYGNKKHCNCFYCRVRLDINEATIEHLIPLSQKGNWKLDNLRVCCQYCNNDRGIKDWEEYKLRWDLFYDNEDMVALFSEEQFEEIRRAI